MKQNVIVNPDSKLALFIRERVAEKREIREALSTGDRDIFAKKGIRLVNPLRPSRKH